MVFPQENNLKNNYLGQNQGFMKNLLLLFALLPFLNHAQSNFFIEQNELIWQKVYDIKSSPEEFKNHLLKNLEFSDIEVSNDQIIATINNLKIDYKGYGKSAFSTSAYIPQSDFHALTIIEFKDDRYRVTVKDISTSWSTESLLYNDGITERIEILALNRNGFKKRFISKDAPIINFTLNKLFKPQKPKKDDW
jgi:hypothetical protein